MNFYHVTEKNNLDSIMNHGLQPRVGPRSEELGEKEAAVYLFPDLESVENALMNWLGAEFDDDSELVILKIDHEGLTLKQNTGYEWMTLEKIDQKKITGVMSENFEEIVHPKIGGMLDDAKSQIKSYLEKMQGEEPSLKKLIEQLETDEDPFSRSNMKGHITTSALILSADGSQVLMVHHNVYDRLLNPGGHHEGTEKLIDGALREGQEETGVQEITVHEWSRENECPFDIDTHPIAENSKKGEKEHFHHDFIYVFVANPEAALKAQTAEVKSTGWFPSTDLAKSGNARLERLHEKMLRNGLTTAASKSPKP